MSNEDDLTEDEINKIKDTTSNISNLASQYIDKFYEDLDNCNSVDEYYSLLTAVFIFKNLVVSQLSRELEQEGDQSPDEVIKQLDDIANNISNLVVEGYSKNSMN